MSPQLVPDLTLRIVHLVDDLDRTERFWVEGVGLQVEYRSEPGPDLPLVMVGLPGSGWHLELVGEPGSAPPDSDDGLVVLYLGEDPEQEWLDRITQHGGRIVSARNAYWDTWGTTIATPSGHRLVLSRRSWPR